MEVACLKKGTGTLGDRLMMLFHLDSNMMGLRVAIHPNQEATKDLAGNNSRGKDEGTIIMGEGEAEVIVYHVVAGDRLRVGEAEEDQDGTKEIANHVNAIGNSKVTSSFAINHAADHISRCL